MGVINFYFFEFKFNFFHIKKIIEFGIKKKVNVGIQKTGKESA